MNCACKYTDKGPLVLCAAHDIEVTRAVMAEREACAVAASTLDRADLVLAPHETYADGRRAAAVKIRNRAKSA
jgi:hypothetical protein